MCVNKSVIYMAILSVCGICSYPILVATGSSPEKSSETHCRHTWEKHRDSEHTKSIVQECLKLHPFQDPNESSSVEESHRILEENQSNCALKCINEGLNVTTEEGLIDVQKIQEFFLHYSNITRSYVLKLTSIMNYCEKRAGEELQVQGGIQQNTCKYHILFMHCYSDAYIASRQEIHKLCKESDESEKT